MVNELKESRQEKKSFFFIIRLILFTLVAGFCIFELFLSFRGLESSAAMDQAQIARQIARGEGFTSLMLRPLDVMTQSKLLGDKVDYTHFAETNYAPLHPYVLSAAVRMGGLDDFESARMETEVSNVYNGDRWIAGTSMVFFVASLVLAYLLFRHLFDEVIGSTVVAFMGLSELMLRYAVSGLAQPMMLTFLLAAAYCLAAAITADERSRKRARLIYVILAFLFIAAVGLSHYIGICLAIGLLVFCGLYFRPYGFFALIGAVMMVVLLWVPASLYLAPGGGIVKHLLHSIHFSFGSDDGIALMRSTTDSAVSFNNSQFFQRLLGYMFGQCGTLFHDMGGIIVTPFFFLALFNRYKRRMAEGIKWAVFSMWLCTCLGMALFSEPGEISPSQLSIIFAPFFAAYGTALVFNLLARMQLGTQYKAYRGLTIFCMLLISSGAFMFELPKKLHLGILTSARGIPHFPPYYPPAFNGKLHDMTKAEDIIMTDQPWAVAWYADRRALWLPTSLDAYNKDLDPTLSKAKMNVQGVLITPTSHSLSEGGVSGVIKETGDFAPLALEGKLLILSPKHNVAFAEFFNEESQNSGKPLAALVSSRGQFAHRNFLLGAEMIYYSKEEVMPTESK